VDIDVQARDEGPCRILVVTGEIDVATAPAFKRHLLEQIAEGHTRLVLDLAGVAFMDSTALGVLVGALTRVRASDGHIALVNVTERVAKVFTITHLTRVFTLHETLEDACADVSSPTAA
jgi:anti-sigma B factor antagonist